MNDIIIRTANASAIPEIQQLYRQLDKHHVDLLPDVFQSVNSDIRDNESIQKWIDQDDADYLLAEVNGRIVGFLNVKKTDHPGLPMFVPHEYAMIDNAVVDKLYRGKGIGSALFAAAIKWASEKGLRYVQVSVWYDNAAAREFYIDQGFRPMTMRLELDTERK